MSFSVLLLIPFGIVVGVGLSFVWWAARQARHDLDSEMQDLLNAPAPGMSPPGPRALLLNPPSRWIAVRARTPETVQRALGLHNPSPCSWSDAIARLDDDQLFVSPPVHGWVLVLGARLPDPTEDVDSCFRFLSRMSHDLGEVQFFHFNRVLGHHAWARFNGGRALRGYAWAGETLWNQGPRTWAERRLGLTCFDYLEIRERLHFAELEHIRLNTDRVPALAAIWSVDPGTVDERALPDAIGVAGDLARPQLS